MVSPKSDRIWRYMSVVELLNILERRALVFRQLRSLRRDDRAEGAIPDDLYTSDAVLSGDLGAKVKVCAQTLISATAHTCNAGTVPKMSTRRFGESTATVASLCKRPSVISRSRAFGKTAHCAVKMSFMPTHGLRRKKKG